MSWSNDDEINLGFMTAIGERTPDEKKFGLAANKHKKSPSSYQFNRNEVILTRKPGSLNSNFNSVSSKRSDNVPQSNMAQLKKPAVKVRFDWWVVWCFTQFNSLFLHLLRLFLVLQ
jgi:hypothetical protein